MDHIATTVTSSGRHFPDHRHSIRIALIVNWKTTRRWLVAAAFALFIVGGLLAGLVLEPEFATITEGRYRDVIDPELQSRARTWYALDWAVWSVTLMAAIALLVALAHPVTALTKAQSGSAG